MTQMDEDRPEGAMVRRGEDRYEPPPVRVPREAAQTDLIERALAKAQMKFEEVVKARKADAGVKGKYSYANLADVVAATKPALVAEGIVPSWWVAGTTMFFRLTHAESGQWKESDLQIVRPDTRGGIQALGSALSYLRRYLYTMALGIVPLDDPDDDGVAAMAAGRMPLELVQYALLCSEAPDVGVGRIDLVEAMRSKGDSRAVQEAALRLFAERVAQRKAEATRRKEEPQPDPERDGR